jgi:energy-coupling factor transporter ATP-binding protein EcfA2
MKIIALTGPKGHGKSTIATYIEQLTKETHHVVRISFAQPLKMACHILFGGTAAHWFGSDKETTLTEWGLTPRFIMQKFADIIRKEPGIGHEGGFGEDFFLRILKKQVEEIAVDEGKLETEIIVIIDDARFDMEATLVKGLGGKVYRIKKLDAVTDTVIDTHRSEAGITENLLDEAFIAVKGDHKLLEKFAKQIISDF